MLLSIVCGSLGVYRAKHYGSILWRARPVLR